MLVSFQPLLEETQGSSDGVSDPEEHQKSTSKRQKSILVRRAVECGLQLLARLSHYPVYLTAEERTKHRTSTGDIDRQQIHGGKSKKFFLFDGHSSDERRPSTASSVQAELTPDGISPESHAEFSMAFDNWNCLPFTRKRKTKERMDARRASVSSDSSKSNATVIELELHIALSCGDITNIVIGEMEPDRRSRGGAQFPATSLVTNSNKRKSNRLSAMSADEVDALNSYFAEYTGRLEYAICGPAVESLEDALSVAKAGELGITPEVYSLIRNQTLDLVYEKRKSFYIVKGRDQDGHAKKPSGSLRHPHQQGKGSAALPHTTYLASKPELKKQASNLNIEPLVPRIRNASVMELSHDPNPNYFKYVNRSALYRLQHSPDFNFPAQFRDVTIMFVSLGKLNPAISEGLNIAQKATTQAMQLLVKYEGMLQQFAVDDKGEYSSMCNSESSKVHINLLGATLLAVFGLPPLSHEREAVFAAKAAIELRDAYRQMHMDDFAIALSTGIVFNAVLPQGNPYRRDPSISGDAIVLAVRMLKFPFAQGNVVCDAATKQQIGGLCDFDDLGENFVKGKVKPIQIYSIEKFGQGGKAKRISQHQKIEKSTDFIGYKHEMDTATRLIDDWMEAQNHHVLIIAGPSGVGKSFFCHALNKSITEHDVQTWYVTL